MSRFHGRRIQEWHDGTMRSLELLEFCEHMPDDGALKTAMRDGHWSPQEAATFQIANELAILRSSQVEGVTSEDIGSRIFIEPAKLRDMAEREAEREEATEAVYAMATVNHPELEEE